MKIHIQNLVAAAAVFSTLNLQHATAFAQGTAFTYSGRLNDGGGAANGSYDLRFTLCDAVTNGTAFGSWTNIATGITNGLFSVMLDFGGVFNGSNCWLEIAARTSGNGPFAALSPRQPILPTPYAIFSANAGNAATAATAGIAGSANSVSATNIIGAVPLTQLPGIVLTNNQSGVTLNGTFGGDGGGLTNLNPAAANAGLPFFAVYPPSSGISERPALGIFTNIQDAISALPVAPDPDHAGGGAIWFAPGIYYTTTNIHTPNTSYPFSLTLLGSGLNACGIVYVGTQAQSVMTLSQPDANDTFIFSMHNMFMASAVNGLTNILYFNSEGGSVGRALISYCWFGYWPSMTNNGCGFSTLGGHMGLTPPTCGDGGDHNLIAIDIDCNFDDKITVEHCSFNFVNCVSLAADHATFNDNFFSFCGGQNSWPSTSPYHWGASIVMTEPADYPNGNEDWNFYNNYFMTTAGFAYYAGNNFSSATPPKISYNDQFEGPINGVITTGTPWVMIDPIAHSTSPPQNYYAPGNGTLIAAPASLVRIVDNRAGINTGNYSFGGNVTVGGVFTGSGAGLTNLSASAITGGLTGRLAVLVPGGGTNILCFTNGILMATQ
jgi:hypothetical protein